MDNDESANANQKSSRARREIGVERRARIVSYRVELFPLSNMIGEEIERSRLLE